MEGHTAAVVTWSRWLHKGPGCFSNVLHRSRQRPQMNAASAVEFTREPGPARHLVFNWQRWCRGTLLQAFFCLFYFLFDQALSSLRRFSLASEIEALLECYCAQGICFLQGKQTSKQTHTHEKQQLQRAEQHHGSAEHLFDVRRNTIWCQGTTYTLRVAEAASI